MAKAKAPAVPPDIPLIVSDEDIEQFGMAVAATKLGISRRLLAGMVARDEVPYIRAGGKKVFFTNRIIYAIQQMWQVDPATRGLRRTA